MADVIISYLSRGGRVEVRTFPEGTKASAVMATFGDSGLDSKEVLHLDGEVVELGHEIRAGKSGIRQLTISRNYKGADTSSLAA